VLILDEPSAGLAPIVLREVYAALDTLQSKGTLGVLLAEQNARAAMSVTRRVVLMSGGHVIAAGRADAFTMADLEAAYLGKFEHRAREAGAGGGPGFGTGGGVMASSPEAQRET
jgi:ABC-type branched-subunit amino acid transport system ATPase component